jgi:hypothetical protein
MGSLRTILNTLRLLDGSIHHSSVWELAGRAAVFL